MKKTTSCLVFTMLSLLLLGQSNGTQILLKIDKEDYTSDSLRLELTLRNSQDIKKCYLKPCFNLVKHDLMRIYMTNKESGKEHMLFLGTGGELDNIKLTYENSFLLAKDESFVKKLNVSLRDFTPRLEKGGVYLLELSVDYSSVIIKSDCCQNIMCNKYQVKADDNIEIRDL